MAEQDKWVYMSHSDVKADPARVTRKAFKDVWEPKGWKLSKEADVKASSSTTKKES